MKPTRLILIPALASQPAPYLVLAGDGGVLERGTLTLDAVERPEPMRTVAVVPGADVTVRWLELPAGGTAQLKAAALWSLRDELAATPDRLAAALGPVPTAGEPRLVAVVGRALLEAWTDYLDALGVRADVLIPDVLTVAAPEGEATVAAVAFGDSIALRGHRFAAAVQADLVDLVAAGRRVEPVEDARDVERALIAAARAPLVNLLDEGRRERGGKVGWKRAAALAAALVVSPLLLTIAGAARDDVAARRIGAETLAAIEKADPALARDADPVGALRRRAASAPPPGGTGAATAALFAAVEAVEGAELDLLSVGPEDGMKATVAHPDYGDMETLSQRMGQAGLSVVETATLDDAGRVVSDITVGAAR